MANIWNIVFESAKNLYGALLTSLAIFAVTLPPSVTKKGLAFVVIQISQEKMS